MKNSLLPAALLAASVAAAQTPVDLSGDWKEIRRMDAGDKQVAFTDTLRLSFTMGNEYLWQQKGSFRYKGTYKATRDKLDLGARYFTILRHNARTLVLKDDNAVTYELRSEPKAEVREDNTQAASGQRGNGEDNGTIDKAALAGTWETYKRTSSVQLREIDYRRVIKKITLQWNGNTLTGTVLPAQHDAQGPAWTIERLDHDTLYCSGPDKRALLIRKCAGGELILQEGTMTCFFKKFKQ